MSDDTALLAAIREYPDEDTPRLAYADWLDEHSRNERAEFIRTQVELARLPDDDPRRTDLEIAERRLLAKNLVEWAAYWPVFGGCEYAGEPPIRACFRRGFLESTEGYGVPGVPLGGNFGELSAAHPIREVNSFGYSVGNLAAAASQSEWRWIESLAISLWTGRNETPGHRHEQFTQIDLFLKHANLPRLRKFVLGLGVSETAMAHWFRLPIFRQLVAMNMWAWPHDGIQLQEISRGGSPHLTELELVTSESPAAVRSLHQLVDSSAWPQLTHVGVTGGANFPWLKALETGRLRRLTLHLLDRQVDVMQLFTNAISSARVREPLEELNIRHEGLHGEQFSTVLASGPLSALRRLNYFHSNLTDDDLVRLSSSPVLRSLNRLTIWLHQSAGAGLETLFASPNLGRLTHLRVYGPVSTAAVEALAQNESCRRLRALSLTGLCESAALFALTMGEPFPELHTFEWGCWRPPPSRDEVEELVNSPKLPRLCVMPFSVEADWALRLQPVFRNCGRIAWAGGEMGDGGDGTRRAIVPENVYLPNHLDDITGVSW